MSSKNNSKEEQQELSPPSSMMMIQSGTMQAHATRLKPQTDLVSGLLQVASEAMNKSTPKSSSAFILSVVGSLDYVKLRMANASRRENNDNDNNNGGENTTTGNNVIKEWKNERFEIVSLIGTISVKGEKHLHMSISNANGEVFGGHLIAGRVFTTLEFVLGTIENVTFNREIDPDTGYKELVVTSSPSSSQHTTTATKTDNDNDDDVNNDNRPNKKSKIY